MSLLIRPNTTDIATNFILIPKEGKYRQLLRETEDVIQRIDPSVVQKMVHNFHAFHEEVTLVEISAS